MYYKEQTEFDPLSFSSDSAVGDDLLDELCGSAEIDRREPVRPAASQLPYRCPPRIESMNWPSLACPASPHNRSPW